MATIIQAKHRGNHDRDQRWARFERADLFERYGTLHTQWVSQRQAATVLDAPRSTLQAWRAYQETFDECPTVVAFFLKVLRGSPSCIASSWHSMWCVSKCVPAGFVWCACYHVEEAIVLDR